MVRKEGNDGKEGQEERRGKRNKQLLEEERKIKGG